MKNSVCDIIVVRGAPASGKSSSAKKLAKFFPRGVRIEIANLRNMVISHDKGNDAEQIGLLGLSAKLITGYLELGYKPVIAVDTLKGEQFQKFLEQIRKTQSDLAIRSFLLHASPAEFQQRMNLRKSWEFRDLNACLRMNEEILKTKFENEFRIDTTGILPLHTAKMMYKKVTNT